MAKRDLIYNIANGAIKKLKGAFHNPYSKIGLSWMKVRELKNLPAHQDQSVELLNGSISFYSRDEFLHSLKEIFIEEIYLQPFGPKPTVIDCGANIGLSVLYIKTIAPDAKIIAFGPDSKNFNFLKRNVQAFQLHDVDIRKEAVWTENTTLQFSNQGSLMSRIENVPSSHTESTKATRLRDLLSEPIDFLKIDIEGAEYAVMKDIEDKLKLVRHLFLEYHGTFEQNEELNELFIMISNAGFRYYVKEAIDKHPTPFTRKATPDYDVQLNIFCFRS